MITLLAGTRILRAAQPVDFRKGAHGLAALAAEGLGQDPFSGVVIVFRSKRADRVKILVWDASGLVLVWTQLEGGAFRWPPIVDGVMRLTPVEFAAQFDGLDWTRVGTPKRIPRPTAAAWTRRCEARRRYRHGQLPGRSRDPACPAGCGAGPVRGPGGERAALEAQNDRLRHLRLKLRRLQFGRKAERLLEEQLERGLADLETAIAQAETEAEKRDPKLRQERAAKRRASRGALPAHLPRIEVVIAPESTLCPCCAGNRRSQYVTI